MRLHISETLGEGIKNGAGDNVHVMNAPLHREKGSTIICALCTILIVSLIGANVLMNCTTRYNVTSKQVAGWQDALCAAEAGGDIAYAETRKTLMNPGTQFSGAGWTSSNVSTGPWAYTTSNAFGAGNLSASVTVDNFTSIDGYACYRIRSVGTARVFGLRRVGMDESPNGVGSSFASGSDVRGRGDTLLRKIDFNYDHFISTYGDGDGNNKQLIAVPTDSNGNPLAQVSRRIESIAVPILPVSGAIKTSGSFYGPGSAGVIDSFNSNNGPYNPNVALGGTPLPQFYSDSRDGNVNCGSSSFTSLTGDIYGNVTTDGATLKSTKYITGTVDNNVPVTIMPQAAVSPPPPSRVYEPTSPTTITPPASNPNCSGQPPDSWANAPWYLYTLLQNVTINPVKVGPTSRETYVNIVVNGDISTNLTINQGVNVRIYFTGNVNIKVSNFHNQNVDGSALSNIDGTPSTNHSASAHVQFYGVSPTAPATQTVNLDANGKPSIEALWYAPGADFISKGNVVMYGAVVCKSFYQNGDCSFHYDKALANFVSPNDYRIASYIEDVR